MKDIFSRDHQFALATSADNRPSVRCVDTFYQDGAFFVVTHAKSQKVQELERNPQVSLCSNLHRFEGSAQNIGHPQCPSNQQIREQLIVAFAPWYFAHNDEGDQDMCYVQITLKSGFFDMGGTGYKVDFQRGAVETFPFSSDVTMVD